MKKILVFVVSVLLCLGAFCGCFSSGENSNNIFPESKKVEVVGTPTWEVDYSEYLGYSVEIKGVIKNSKSVDYSYVSVEFSIYDAEGNNLGTAMDNMNNLASGDTWKFNATSIGWFEDEPVSFKLVEITSW